MYVSALNENTQAEIWVGPEGPVKCFLFAMPRRPWKCTVLTVLCRADACTLSTQPPLCACICCVYMDTCTYLPQMNREMESCPAELYAHPLSTFLPLVFLLSLVPPAPTLLYTNALRLFFSRPSMSAVFWYSSIRCVTIATAWSTGCRKSQEAMGCVQRICRSEYVEKNLKKNNNTIQRLRKWEEF